MPLPRAGNETTKGCFMVQFILPQNGKSLIKVGNKIVGHIENGIFYKPVIGSKHMLRQPPAWAVDAEVFDNEVMAKATEIVVIDKETSIEYSTSVESFNRQKGELDRGFGRQYYLNA